LLFLITRTLGILLEEGIGKESIYKPAFKPFEITKLRKLLYALKLRLQEKLKQ
jgi:hypothetical protein